MMKDKIVGTILTLVIALSAWAGVSIINLKEKVVMLETSKDYFRDDLIYIKNKLNTIDDKISKMRRR